jgi:hypothetical protein
LFFLNYYSHFKIDNLILQTEFISTENLNYSNKKRDDGIHDLLSISNILNELPKTFTETLKIINILSTLHVTTASNERFFLSLNKL